MVGSLKRLIRTGLAVIGLGTAAGPAWAIDYLNVTAQPDRAVPGACLSFTSPLPRGQTQALDPFVGIVPATDHGLQARGKDLCISGLKHGTHYAIRLKAGLPGADGSTLPRDVPVDVKIPDREPQVSFDGGKTLLPWRQDVGLPLKSTNVGKARLVLYRFAERGIVEQLANDWFGEALSGWSLETISDRAQKLFEGTLDIAAKSNEQVTTAIPLDQFVKTIQPGIYVATAVPDGQKPDSDVERATQWFSVSDIGLVTIKTDSGLLVSAHSLASGAPMADLDVRLLARSNEVLGTYKTDAGGRVLVPAGLLRGEHGDAPRLLTAVAPRGDFTWLRLDTPALDLSDLDIKGRAPPSPRDAFLWSDRGIYRPGETMHVGAMLRDSAAKPIAKVPVTLHLVRPDGVEVSDTTPDLSRAGGGTVDIAVPDNAYTGTWTIWASAGGKERIGSIDVTVEDFVPPRLETKVELPQPAEAGAPFMPLVTANYFYGSPGSDLSGQVEATIQPAAKPFPGFEGFTFGLVQEPFLPRQLDAQSFTTDDKGHASVTFPQGETPDSTGPLELSLHATVNDVDGRPAEAETVVPLHSADRFIGLRAASSALPDGADAAIDVALVDGGGKPLGAESLKWDLVKEDYQYSYFYRDSRWQSEETVIDTRVSGGEVALGPDGRGRVTARVTNGRWRLEAYDAAGKTATSLRFGAGWWASAQTAENQKPETFPVTLDPAAPAGTVRAVLAPTFAGRVLVVLEGNGLHGVQEVDLPKGGGPVEFSAADVPPSGAYVVAVAIAPSGTVLPRLPVRALGLAWVPGSAAQHRLDVTLDAPDKIAPKTTLDVDVSVPTAAASGAAYVTLAAVDEAVLRMTDFATPDPAEHYLGKRAPGFELRDVYGSLIDPSGQAGRLVEGGDARAKLQIGALDVKTFKTVALFQGPVQLDSAGKARIAVAVPEFSGRLRLMAIAWTPDAFGKAERPVTVRPPLLAELTLPRFLAPGDKIRARAMLTDLEAPEQTYSVDLAAAGAVSFDKSDIIFKDVKRDKRRFADRVLTAATSPGVGRIHMTVTGQDGTTKAERDFEIAVRSPNAYVTTNQVRTLEPGGHLTAGDALGTGLAPGTATLDATVSTVPAFDIPGLLAELRRYPYGCTEQTVSRAFPELFAARLGGADPAPVPGAVTGQGAIARLFSLQAEDGSFGYWTAFDTGHLWLTAYAVDYLQHAAAQGLQVPDTMPARALDWLAGRLGSLGTEKADIAGGAYAALVLARANRIDLSQLRYFATRAEAQLPSEAARVQLAAALAHVGERDRAAALMRASVQRDPKIYLNDYGSPLRDAALTVSLMAEEKLAPDGAVLDRANNLARATSGQTYMSTQEKAWILRGAFDLHGTAPLHAEINGAPNTDAVRMAASVPLGSGRQADIRNLGAEPIYVSLATTGIPLAPEPAEAKGFTIARSYFALDGSAFDIGGVHQTDEIVTVVEGTMADPLDRKVLVVDLLPAGFEPDTAVINADQGDDGKFAWLKDLTEPTFRATRDDRFVAGLTLSGDNAKFKLAYIVRAVTPGTYVLPGAQIEDMYAPAYHARTAAGVIEVKGPKTDSKPAPKAQPAAVKTGPATKP